MEHPANPADSRVGEDENAQIQELKRRIRSYDSMYARHQQEGKAFEALEFLEKGLFLRKELLGTEHPEVSKVCQVFTTSCNTLAMNALQKENFMVAFELLKKAEILTAPNGYVQDKKMRMKLRAVTFNNFGCFYKRRGKLHAALQYLAKALKLEMNSQEVDNPAGTHLNLCATLSQLGRHGPALEHAQCALQLLETSQQAAGESGGDDSSILAIAWHNTAVEQEHLNQFDDALGSYQQAVKVAEREWGPQHIKTLAIRHSFEEARQKVAQKQTVKKDTHPAASPLDSLLNPAQAGRAVSSKTSKSKFSAKSPLKKGSAKIGGKSSRESAPQKVTQNAAVSSWNSFLQSGAGAPPGHSSSGLPPINEGMGAVGMLDAAGDGVRRGPRTPDDSAMAAAGARPRRHVG